MKVKDLIKILKRIEPEKIIRVNDVLGDIDITSDGEYIVLIKTREGFSHYYKEF